MGVQIDFDVHDAQADALELILSAGPRVDVLMGAGTGGGKTVALCMAATSLALANPPGVDGMLVEPTYGMITDVLRPTLEELWDEYGIPYVWMAGPKKYYLPWSRNCIRLRSAKNYNNLRGPSLAWVGADEAAYQDQRAYEIQMSRIRHPRARKRCWFGATTPAGYNWCYKQFGDPLNRPHGNALVTWATGDNAFVLDEDPMFVERLAAAYSGDLFRQEVEGQFLVVAAGRTYHQFDRRRHLRDFELDGSMPLDLCVDFNVAPSVWVVAQGMGTVPRPERAIDEIVSKGDLSTYKQIQAFQERYPEHAYGEGVRIFGDASGKARKTTGFSDFEVISEELPYARVCVRKANPREKDRVNAVNAMLRNAKGQVRAYIHSSRCPSLLRDFEMVRNVEGTFQIDKKADPELTHASDAWGYKIHWCYPVVARRNTRKREIEAEGRVN